MSPPMQLCVARATKMPRVLALLAFFCALALIARGDGDSGEKYSSRYDNVNVDEILSTPRLRKQYEKCFMEEGPCITADAKFLKDKFPEALVTKCRKCTDKQRIFFEKITVWYTENDRETWDKILKKAIDDARSNRIIRNGR